MDIHGLGCCAIEEINFISDNNSQLDTLTGYANHHYEPAREITKWVPAPSSKRNIFLEPRGMHVGTGEFIPAKWTTPAFVIFSEAAGGKYASKLRDLIEKYKLGEVQVSPTRLNPNSENNVTVYLWSIDREAFHTWAIDNEYVEVNNGN